MKIMLERPVEYGEIRLAPTSELAALAELSELYDHDDRLAAIIRTATTLRSEDAVRDRIAKLRSGELEPDALPRRSRVGSTDQLAGANSI